jgi:hypothetical protein
MSNRVNTEKTAKEKMPSFCPHRRKIAEITENCDHNTDLFVLCVFQGGVRDCLLSDGVLPEVSDAFTEFKFYPFDSGELACSP